MARRPSPSASASLKPFSIFSVAVLSLGAIRTSVLPSKVLRDASLISLRSADQSIHLRSAEMKTSAGAPASICFASADDAANDEIALLPDFASQSLAMRSMAFLRLAAAKTTTGFDAAALPVARLALSAR